MHPDVLELCCLYASALVSALLPVGFFELLCWLDDGNEGTFIGRLIIVGISVGVNVLSLYLFELTQQLMDSYADIPGNKRDRRRKEEERKEKEQDLFESFPSVSYPSQGIKSGSGDCVICLGDFLEGDPVASEKRGHVN
ncbi:MFS domain-containing protein [Psidium guajava]|nr:MFS domain-containing protein [Psidium guajava]